MPLAAGGSSPGARPYHRGGRSAASPSTSPRQKSEWQVARYGFSAKLSSLYWEKPKGWHCCLVSVNTDQRVCHESTACCISQSTKALFIWGVDSVRATNLRRKKNKLVLRPSGAALNGFALRV